MIHHPDLSDISLEQVLAALSDPVRLEIVRLADSEPDQACRVFTSQIPKSTASHHWRVLREAGIIEQRQSGTHRLNSLRRDELDARFPGLLDAVLRSVGGDVASATDPANHRG